ncbi:MAG: 50S ribosomal protein L2 [Candidatus Magasanikbacteria bacterium]|nr:50S ribosomal protein L2 [Candidatus Magasanikbacteria bacterium]
MPVKIYRPNTAGRRKASVLDFSELTKKSPEKHLLRPLVRKAGRNNSGKITIRHRGGGAKRMYRMVDFNQTKLDMPAKVIAIEYDPNRGPNIALIEYADSEKSYVLAAKGMEPGMSVLSSQAKIEASLGARMPLEHIPVGMFVYNIENEPGKGGSIVRAAGAAAQLQTIEGNFVQLKLPSGEVRMLLKQCRASVGQVGNSDHKLVRLGKAGRMRLKGWRPTVRGKVMNPVDHPHGGGEGRNPIGLKGGPKTPWGKKALGVKTRKKGKPNSSLILRRRNVKK